jgi:hypothetical protein
MLLDEASASVKLANLKDSFNHTANATFARLRSFSDPHHRLAGTSFFQHEEDEGTTSLHTKLNLSTNS